MIGFCVGVTLGGIIAIVALCFFQKEAMKIVQYYLAQIDKDVNKNYKKI